MSHDSFVLKSRLLPDGRVMAKVIIKPSNGHSFTPEPGGFFFACKDPKRKTSGQNQAFHAICTQVGFMMGEGLTCEQARENTKNIFKKALKFESWAQLTRKAATKVLDSITEFCMTHNITLRCDDVTGLSWQQKAKLGLKYKQCMICGKKAERHHTTCIGMGRNRNKVKDERVLPFCFHHHRELETIGRHTFTRKHELPELKGLAQDVLDMPEPAEEYA